jgi:hypothetical protein
MLNDLNCKKCNSIMKKIPIKRLDSTIVVEYYCEKCDYSISYYPELDKLIKIQPSFF